MTEGVTFPKRCEPENRDSVHRLERKAPTGPFKFGIGDFRCLGNVMIADDNRMTTFASVQIGMHLTPQ